MSPTKHLGDIWWQQDGAPAHSSHAVADHLEVTFGEKVISRSFQTWKKKGLNWAASSADLSPLDFFLNGELKRLIWEDKKPKNLAQLKSKAEKILRNWNQEALKNGIFSFVGRVKQCHHEKGNFFEYLR